MGHIRVNIRVRNVYDVERRARGEIAEEQVRTAELEALVDTGATSVSLPGSVIRELGLLKIDERMIRTANGSVLRGVFSSHIEVTGLGRAGYFGAVEVPEDCPPLLGVVLLEDFDLVVDPVNETLVANPAHGGRWTSYAYGVTLGRSRT